MVTGHIIAQAFGVSAITYVIFCPLTYIIISISDLRRTTPLHNSLSR